MARPTKQGIEYFPLDAQFDDKIELLISETGAEGLGILITLWQIIYHNNGYYIEDSEDICLLIRRRVMSDIDTIRTVIDASVRRGIFDYDMHSTHGILTSKAIQKRYFDAAKRKKTVNVVENYICSGVIVSDNKVNVCINATKVKEEVKVEVKEKVKVKEDKPLVPQAAPVDVQTIFDHWKTILNHPRSNLDPKRITLIKKWLNTGYNVQDLKAAISGCSKTAHNMGKNDNAKRYDTIELIFRDAGQIDRFMKNDAEPGSVVDSWLGDNEVIEGESERA